MIGGKPRRKGTDGREGVSLEDFFAKFPSDEAAEEWYIRRRWPDGVRCPRCGGDNVYEPGGTSPMRFRCRDCRRCFSTKSGTVMAHSNLGYKKWLTALYLFHTNLKGVSARKLRRDLGVSHPTAWHLAHRIRMGWVDESPQFTGLVEVDETYVGGIERNKHIRNKLPQGQQVWRGVGTKGKVIVAGARHRATKQVKAKVVTGTDRVILRSFVREVAKLGTVLHTDHQGAYDRIPGYPRHAVNHTALEFVRGDVTTNGIESFWSMFKRGFMGTYHLMSAKHLQRYVDEFCGRHNVRMLDTMDQLERLAQALVGKRLRWADLTAA
ncbi:MAG: IS1595 family transposase [bacterium]|nr:IS1595 family transposase [bacterium]